MNDSSNKTILVFVAGFVIGALIFFFVGQNWKGIAGKGKAVNEPLTSEVKAISGKVTQVQTGSITIEVKNLFLGAQSNKYQVYADDRTEVEKVVLAKTGGAQLFGKQVSSSKIKLSDIKTGDEVMAWSTTNIAGKNSFASSKIQVRVYK